MYLSSCGGHLVQLIKIMKYINDKDFIFIVNDRFDIDKEMIGKTKIITHAERTSWKQIINALESIIYILKYRPKILISTGASPAVPFSICAKIIGSKIIFIESISRVYSPSLTGKLMSYIADKLYVQWDSLQNQLPKSIYVGNLLK